MNVRTTCHYCKKDFPAHHKKNGTSGLKQHLESYVYYKRTLAGDVDVGRMLLNYDASRASSGDVGVMWVTRKFDEKAIRELIARMVIIDELPFLTVQKVGFRTLMHYLEPRFKMPSRYTLMRDCMSLYLREKIKLKEGFRVNKYRVCLTTDTWTSIQNYNYMCVTGHFIDCN